MPSKQHNRVPSQDLKSEALEEVGAVYLPERYREKLPSDAGEFLEFLRDVGHGDARKARAFLDSAYNNLKKQDGMLPKELTEGYAIVFERYGWEDHAKHIREFASPMQKTLEEKGVPRESSYKLAVQLEYLDIGIEDLDKIAEKYGTYDVQPMKVFAGTSIYRASADAFHLATKTGKPVVFEFAQAIVGAGADESLWQIIGEYRAEQQRRSDAYWTPERLAAKAQKEASDQVTLDIHVEGLEKVDMSDPVEAIEWLCRLEEISYTYTNIDRDYVLKTYARAGYVPSMNTGSESNREDQENYKGWVIGVGLGGVEFLGTPHPVLHSIAKEYKQKFGLLEEAEVAA